MASLADESTLESIVTVITLLPEAVGTELSDFDEASVVFRTAAITVVLGRCARASSSPLPSPRKKSQLPGAISRINSVQTSIGTGYEIDFWFRHLNISKEPVGFQMRVRW